jgi:flagellar basal body L-ring protein FlgH
MIETIVAAIAAISFLVLAEHGRGPVPDLRKISTKTMTSLVIAYTPGTSMSRFWIFGDQPVFEDRSPRRIYNAVTIIVSSGARGKC